MAKLKVFVSSTVEDLEAERSLVKNVLEELYFSAFISEYGSAQARSPQDACLVAVAESDLFVLLIGERYGFVPTENQSESPYDGQISATQGEFFKARELRKPILVFVKDGPRDPREQAFLDQLADFLDGRVHTTFKSVGELRGKLLEAISNLLVDLVRHNYVVPWKKKPNVMLLESRDDVARAGARILGRAIQSRPNPNIGLSAGRTARDIYYRFFQEFDAAEMKNLPQTCFFSVTEHFGISRNNPNSYYHWYHEAFFDRVKETWGLTIPEEHKKLVPSMIERNTVDGFKLEYDQHLEIHKVDLQIITPAPNGQIICIDPNSYPLEDMINMGTFLIRFSKDTSGYLVPVSPHDVDIIIGIKNLLGRSERLLVPVFGADKKDVVRRMILGPVSNDCPASLVSQYPNFNNLLFVIDKESSQGLPRELERHVKLIRFDQLDQFWF